MKHAPAAACATQEGKIAKGPLSKPRMSWRNNNQADTHVLVRSGGGTFIDLDIRLEKSFGPEGKDAWSLASYFKPATGDIIGYKAELTRPEPNVVSYRLHPPCLWFPDLDIPPSFCEALGCFEREAAKIVNPDIEIRHVQLMTAGDPICEIHFIEKETPDRQDGKGR